MTYKDDAIVALHEADDLPLRAREVGKRMVSGPTDATTVMKDLYDDGYVDREGEGKRGDPYRYELTGKGEAAARDLTGEEPDGDAGLDVLFADEDDREAPPDDAVTHPDDVEEPVEVEGDEGQVTIDHDEDGDEVAFPNPAALLEQIEDVRYAVDGLEDRLSSVEDAVGSNNVAREDVKYRLRELEDAVDGADHVVAFDDKEFVETVLMVAQSDYGGSTKKRHVLSTLLGVEDAEEKGLLSRTLSAGNKKGEGKDAKTNATEDDANHD